MNFYRAHLAMLLFSLLVAGSFSFGTRVANLMEPAAMMALRFLIAGILVGSIAHFLVGFRRAHFKAPWRYLVLGGLFAIYFGLMFEGLKTAAPVSAAAVFTLTPLMTAGFAYLILRQRMTLWMLSGLMIGAVGAVWVIFGGDIAAMLRFQIGRGEAVYFVGCVAHSIYPPMVRRLNRGEHTVVFTFGMIFMALILLSVLGAKDLAQTNWGALPQMFWWVLIYLAVCASSMTFFLLQYASMNLPSANVMAYTYLTPSWVIGLEYVLGTNLPPNSVFLGVLATVVALFMLLRKQN